MSFCRRPIVVTPEPDGMHEGRKEQHVTDQPTIDTATRFAIPTILIGFGTWPFGQIPREIVQDGRRTDANVLWARRFR